MLDLAHASEPAMREVLELASKPLVVSHTGLKSQLNSSRTLSDEMVRLVAAGGGVVGIGLWPKVQPSQSIQAIIETVVEAVAVGGAAAVSIGSDYDGAVSVPRGLDAAGLPRLTAGLLAAGLAEAEVRQVMGGNAMRVLAAALPDEDDDSG